MEAVCPIVGRVTKVEPTEFSQGDWKIVRCTETGFVFLSNPPDYSRLESEFAWESTFVEEKTRRHQTEPLVSRLSVLAARVKGRLFPNRNRYFSLASTHLNQVSADATIRILDIGCGTGTLLRKMHDAFHEAGRSIVPHGIEVSLKFAERASAYVSEFGGHVTQANAVAGTSALPPNSLDIALMSSFLEHECQPLLLLKQLHEVLVDRGTIILKVPNFACVNRALRGNKWCGFRFPDHVSYFTPSTLSILAEAAGFRCHQTTFDRLPTSDTMYAVLEKVPVANGVQPVRIRKAA